MNKNTIIMLAVGVVLAGGVGFFAGKSAGAASATGGAPQFGGGMGQGSNRQAGQGRRNGGGGFVTGDVMSKDAQTLSVTMHDGSSKVIIIAPSTQVNKMAPGTMDDIQVGTGVMVQGDTNSDGSVIAKSIQIRPLRQDQGQNGQAQPAGNHPAPQGDAPQTN